LGCYAGVAREKRTDGRRRRLAVEASLPSTVFVTVQIEPLRNGRIDKPSPKVRCTAGMRPALRQLHMPKILPMNWGMMCPSGKSLLIFLHGSRCGVSFQSSRLSRGAITRHAQLACMARHCRVAQGNGHQPSNALSVSRTMSAGSGNRSAPREQGLHSRQAVLAVKCPRRTAPACSTHKMVRKRRSL
jgi:hypothetical protein